MTGRRRHGCDSKCCHVGARGSFPLPSRRQHVLDFAVRRGATGAGKPEQRLATRGPSERPTSRCFSFSFVSYHFCLAHQRWRKLRNNIWAKAGGGLDSRQHCSPSTSKQHRHHMSAKHQKIKSKLGDVELDSEIGAGSWFSEDCGEQPPYRSDPQSRLHIPGLAGVARPECRLDGWTPSPEHTHTQRKGTKDGA